MAAGVDLIAGVVAAATSHWVINGLPLEATYLQSGSAGCAVATARANDWRKTGKRVVEQRVGQWCVVGTAIDGYWLSEQWQAQSISRKGAYGWRVRIPLRASFRTALTKQSDWALDVLDPSISTRIQFRSSLDSLDAHHQKSLRILGDGVPHPQSSDPRNSAGNPLRVSRLSTGDLVVSGSSSGSRYSVVVQRVLRGY